MAWTWRCRACEEYINDDCKPDRHGCPPWDAIIRQLDWDPEVDDSAVGVAAKDGVVTLTGFIDSYAGKLAAEHIHVAVGDDNVVILTGTVGS